ncbi:hypothetical protein [Arenibacter algicola]|nr:hypothetical protein [Arenibacter algicola]
MRKLLQQHPFLALLLQDWWIGAKKDIAERAARKGNAQKRRI